MFSYFRFEKARVERKRVAEASKGMGRPKVGGEFELVDQEGKNFDDEALKGGFSLVSRLVRGRQETGVKKLAFPIRC